MAALERFHEYETRTVALNADSARRLVDAAGPALSISPGAVRGTYDITAGHHVGSIVVGDISVVISPKIKPDNLFLMLEAGIPADRWRKETLDYKVDQNLLPSVISFFARTVDAALARGVLRAYRSIDERLVALRGRIDLREQIRQPALASPVACTFDEYTSDNAENRYLRAALRRARRVTSVPIDVRRSIERSLIRLDEVSDVIVQPDDFDRMVFTRLNRHYEPALRLARLVLSNLTLLDDHGDAGASSFLVDMNDLFQRFVTLRLRRALNGSLRLIDEPTRHLGRGGQVTMYPDLEFHDPLTNRATYVGDVKYKITADGRARSADYYQMLAYCTALNLPEGVLIYCLADGDPPRRVVEVVHTDIRLRTFPIDLRGDADAVDGAIQELADWIKDRSRAIQGVAA